MRSIHFTFEFIEFSFLIDSLSSWQHKSWRGSRHCRRKVSWKSRRVSLHSSALAIADEIKEAMHFTSVKSCLNGQQFIPVGLFCSTAGEVFYVNAVPGTVFGSLKDERPVELLLQINDSRTAKKSYYLSVCLGAPLFRDPFLICAWYIRKSKYNRQESNMKSLEKGHTEVGWPIQIPCLIGSTSTQTRRVGLPTRLEKE